MDLHLSCSRFKHNGAGVLRVLMRAQAATAQSQSSETSTGRCAKRTGANLQHGDLTALDFGHDKMGSQHEPSYWRIHKANGMPVSWCLWEILGLSPIQLNYSVIIICIYIYRHKFKANQYDPTFKG